VTKPYVHCDEHVKPTDSTRDKFAVLNSCPTDSGHGLYIMVSEISFQAPIQVFVEEYSQEVRRARERGIETFQAMLVPDLG
jgi:hypothetical protein